MKSTNIHGKEYIQVNERLKYFREHYPKYSLESEWIRIDEQVAFCRAVVRDESDRLVATGTAFEELSQSGVNSTSHVENCETSAWGRALGNFGIGIDTAVATEEEVENAIDKQGKPTMKQIKFMQNLLDNKLFDVDREEWLEKGRTAYEGGVGVYSKYLDQIKTELDKRKGE